MKNFYLQLYSVKNELTNDFKGTLKKVADMGYEGVEFCANYGGMNGDELNEYLEFLGLSAVSAHISLVELENNFEYHADILRKCGCMYMVCPWADLKTVEDCDALAKRLDAVADKCAKNGFNFAYHNHASEFQKTVDGTYFYDYMMQKCSPLILNELDVYWLKYSDTDIEETLRKYSGRINLLHLKQLDIVNGEKRVSTLNKGIIDFKLILNVGKLLGTEYFIVEQEGTPYVSELDDVKESLNYLKSIKL